MRKSLLLGVGFALCGGVVLANTPPTPGPKLDAADTKVITELDKRLRKLIKTPNNSLRLTIKPTEKASDGYFKEIDIQGSPAQLKKLHVSSFSLHSSNIHLDVDHLFKDRKVQTLAAKTSLTVVVTEDDLTTTLADGKTTQDMNLKVKYLGDRISVTGNLNWALLNGPIEGTAKLRMAPGHQVFLDILSLKLRGVEVPEFLKSKFSDKINPIINYSDLPFNPPFRGVKVEGPKATIYTG